MYLFYFWCNVTVNSTSMGDRGSGSNMNLSVDDYEIDDMFYAGEADHTGKVYIYIYII